MPCNAVAPTPSLPAASIRPAVTVTPQPRAPAQAWLHRCRAQCADPYAAPRSEAPVRVAAPWRRVARLPYEPAPVEPRVEAPAAPRSAPSNVFSGGSAGATRAQSVRGNTLGPPVKTYAPSTNGQYRTSRRHKCPSLHLPPAQQGDKPCILEPVDLLPRPLTCAIALDPRWHHRLREHGVQEYPSPPCRRIGRGPAAVRH